jgi:hypothetical protein
MTKPVISVLVYQVGTTQPLTTPQTQGIHVGSIRGTIVPTWTGGLPQPKSESGVFNENLRWRVYSYIEYVTPSNTALQRIYTSSTVAQTVTDINT